MGLITVPKEKIPKNLKKIQFKHTGGKYYSLNCLMYKDDIDQITNRSELVFKDKKITVFFPIENTYYGKHVNSEHGFTIEDIVKAMQKVGIRAIKHAFKTDKPEELLAEYGLYLIWRGDNEVYAEAQRGSLKNG